MIFVRIVLTPTVLIVLHSANIVRKCQLVEVLASTYKTYITEI